MSPGHNHGTLVRSTDTTGQSGDSWQGSTAASVLRVTNIATVHSSDLVFTETGHGSATDHSTATLAATQKRHTEVRRRDVQ